MVDKNAAWNIWMPSVVLRLRGLKTKKSVRFWFCPKDEPSSIPALLPALFTDEHDIGNFEEKGRKAKQDA